MTAETRYNDLTNFLNLAKEEGFIETYSPRSEMERILRATIAASTVGTMGGLGLSALTKSPRLASGMSAGFGAGSGLLLSTLLQNKFNTGASSTNKDMLNLLSSVAGGSLGYWLERRKSRPEQEKQGGITLEQVRHHLPSISVPESVVGTATGGIAGWLMNKLRNTQGRTKKEKRIQKYKDVLLGSSLGFFGGNLAGDRLRRYISNKVIPFGYNLEDKSLKPKNTKELVTALLKDKPTFNDPDRPDNEIATRYELWRRLLGVHKDNPATDKWLRQSDGSLSLNPGSSSTPITLELRRLSKTKVKDPMSRISDATVGRRYVTEFVPDIVGGQVASIYPISSMKAKPDYLANTKDRWDMTIDNKQKDFLWKNILNRIFRPKLLSNQKVDEYNMVSDYVANASSEITSKHEFDSLMARHLLDKLIVKEYPWIAQRAYYPYDETTNRYKVIPMTQDGVVYTSKHKG